MNEKIWNGLYLFQTKSIKNYIVVVVVVLTFFFYFH
jgi:hypothetical protein